MSSPRLWLLVAAIAVKCSRVALGAPIDPKVSEDTDSVAVELEDQDSQTATDQSLLAPVEKIGSSGGEGQEVGNDEVKTFEFFRTLAEQGDARAQLYMGWMYADGRGVARDDSEAAKWYTKSAEQNNRAAQFYLACMYESGRGLPKNDKEAVKWFRRASDQNLAIAQNWLGWMYQEGRGVQQDYEESAKWFRKAAKLDLPDAQCNLGRMYPQGIGSASRRRDGNRVVSKCRRAGSQLGPIQPRLDVRRRPRRTRQD